MKELKQCPFCGGEAYVQKHDFDMLNSTYGVICLECCCETYQFYNTQEMAIEAWNKRVKDGEK